MVVLEAFFSVSGKKRKEYVRIYHKRRKVSFVYARFTLKNHFGNELHYSIGLDFRRKGLPSVDLNFKRGVSLKKLVAASAVLTFEFILVIGRKKK